MKYYRGTKMGMYFNDEKTIKEKQKEANKRVGIKTKIIRKSLKLTQKEFAKEYSIKGGNSAVSKIENAKRSLSADLLPILAEDGNITVEQFYRDDVVVKNIIYECLSRMDVEANYIEPMMNYVNTMANEAISNIGAIKLFDLIFTVIRVSSMKGNIKGIMMDEINVIDWSDYENNKNSRYIKYLMEMINNTNND